MTATKPVPSMESLRAQRDHFIEKAAKLQAQVNALELELSVVRLGKTLDTEARLAALEKAQDRTANLVQGMVGGPSMEEWERVKSDVSFLMAHTNV